MTLMMKTLGDYSWGSYVWDNTNQSPVRYADSIVDQQSGPQMTIALLKDVFNPIVLRGLMGFMVWWLCSVWFTTSTIGFVYHSYFS